MSPARAWTQNAPSGIARTNHEVTAPPTTYSKKRLINEIMRSQGFFLYSLKMIFSKKKITPHLWLVHENLRMVLLSIKVYDLCMKLKNWTYNQTRELCCIFKSLVNNWWWQSQTTNKLEEKTLNFLFKLNNTNHL